MSTVEITHEPHTYRPDAGRSFFRDLIDAEQGDFAASERLARHAREVADEMERRDKLAFDQKPEGVEYRVNPNRTPGTGGNAAPPLWLIDHFAGVPRPGRVLSDLLPQFPLPSGVGSVNVPRLTTGTAATATADGEPAADTDVVDLAVTSPVVAIAGQGDISLQLLEQSPPGAHMDWAIFRDLEEAYNAQLEAQLVNGGGTALGQLLGLIQIAQTLAPAANVVTYTSGSPVATAMYASIGQMIAAIGNNRKRPPETWLMTTSRQGWIATSEDTQSRPLLLTGMDEAGKFQLAQYPVELDDAIPRTVNTNQEPLILCRPSDGLLLESAPRTMIDFNSLSGTLQARVQMHRYVAALNARYPSGTAILTGTGTVPVANY